MRRAACACGQLSATIAGEPVRVSVCHCHDCQRRSGSAFAAQARFATANVAFAGESRTWEKSGGRATFHWCPVCGGALAFTGGGIADTVAIPLGAFDPGDAPLPAISIYEDRMQPWVAIVGDGIEHHSQMCERPADCSAAAAATGMAGQDPAIPKLSIVSVMGDVANGVRAHRNQPLTLAPGQMVVVVTATFTTAIQLRPLA